MPRPNERAQHYDDGVPTSSSTIHTQPCRCRHRSRRGRIVEIENNHPKTSRIEHMLDHTKGRHAIGGRYPKQLLEARHRLSAHNRDRAHSEDRPTPQIRPRASQRKSERGQTSFFPEENPPKISVIAPQGNPPSRNASNTGMVARRACFDVNVCGSATPRDSEGSRAATDRQEMRDRHFMSFALFSPFVSSGARSHSRCVSPTTGQSSCGARSTRFTIPVSSSASARSNSTANPTSCTFPSS